MIRRRIFTLASLLSLLLCHATAVLWARSYWCTYTLWYQSRVHHDRAWGMRITAPRGLLYVGRWKVLNRPGTESEFYRQLAAQRKGWRLGWRLEKGETLPYSGPAALIRGLWTFQAFAAPSSNYDPSDPTLSSRSEYLFMPLWVFVVVLAVLPGFQMFCRLRSARRLGNQAGCPKCGYSLTGNTSGICPECGTAVARKADA